MAKEKQYQLNFLRQLSTNNKKGTITRALNKNKIIFFGLTTKILSTFSQRQQRNRAPLQLYQSKPDS